MRRTDINTWAKRFADDQNAAGARILFERVVARHFDDLTRLRELGLSWPDIAAALVLAGVRRSNNGIISADQIRAAYSRLLKRNSSNASVARTRQAPRPPVGVPADDAIIRHPSPAVPSTDDRSGRQSAPPPVASAPSDGRSSAVRAAMRRAHTLRGRDEG